MNRDPIVDEIRAIRDDLAKRYDYGIDAIVRALQKASVDEGRQLVSLPPRPSANEDEGRKASWRLGRAGAGPQSIVPPAHAAPSPARRPG
jgi:hypothetical protein